MFLFGSDITPSAGTTKPQNKRAIAFASHNGPSFFAHPMSQSVPENGFSFVQPFPKDDRLMKRPNALHPDKMTPADRRAELCGLLARGLIRLRMRDAVQLSANTRESSLHNPANQSGTAEPTHRRTA
jgi:hypothetical protein